MKKPFLMISYSKTISYKVKRTDERTNGQTDERTNGIFFRKKPF